MKTFKSNKYHPFLIEGTEVITSVQFNDTYYHVKLGENFLVLFETMPGSPKMNPEWYDEVEDTEKPPRTLRDMKVGDVIVNEYGGEAKVLVVLDKIFCRTLFGESLLGCYWNTFDEAGVGGWHLKEQPVEEPKERWKPEEDERYFFIDADGEILETNFVDDCSLDEGRYEFGNCFETYAKALPFRERVRKALKGW